MIKIIILKFWDKIRGIKYGPKITKNIELNQNTTKQEIEAIISTLDHSMVISFYDAYHNLKPSELPTVYGDNGAFTDIRKDKLKLKIKRGNHGWHEKKWSVVSKTDLINIIYKSRKYNKGKMRMESRVARKLWIRQDNDKLLVYFYHSA